MENTTDCYRNKFMKSNTLKSVLLKYFPIDILLKLPATYRDMICYDSNQKSNMKLHLQTGLMSENDQTKLNFLYNYKRYSSFKITIDD